jgi:hypothetical protein
MTLRSIVAESVPWDPYDFGPHGSGSESVKSEVRIRILLSSSKIVRNALIPTVL